MPYVSKERRAKIDPTLNPLIELLLKVPVDQVDGELNYVVTRILNALYPPRYFNYNRAVGVLECIKQEFYRRRVAPYEDKKIKEHGDII
ncbi:MAG: hypothetical protein ABIH76_09200 [Candidatus Bathyarchaeota archaeon]